MSGAILKHFLSKVSKSLPAPRPIIEAMEARQLLSAAAPVATVLVPAYFYPTPGGDWDRMAAAAAGGTPVTAILNPDSGPGRSADPVYAAAVSKLRTDGGHVVGYVHTRNSNGSLRSLKTVEAEVLKYKAFYHLDGIFVDEMMTISSAVTYYHNLYVFTKSQNPSYEVIGNPGTDTQEAYLTAPAADVLVDFEDNQSGYKSQVPPSWVHKHASSHFGNIVGTAKTVSVMNADLAQARRQGAGFVYVTDQDINNNNTAYTRLPTYWTQEVAAVRAEDGLQ
jgi:hypothetical protein